MTPFHHRLDKKDAVTQTVGEFLDKLTSGEDSAYNLNNEAYSDFK